MDNVKIIAVVGMSGAGKSVVVEYLTRKKIPKVYFGGMILGEMEKRGIERTAESEKEFREMIRATEGKDWVVRKVIENVKNLIAAGQKRIVLDGLYSWTEYKILKKEFPRSVTVVGVIVDKAIRYERVGKRPERPFNREEIERRDWSEIENIEKGGPIAAADYYIDGNNNLEWVYERIEQILSQLEF